MEKTAFAALVQEGFDVLGYQDPVALLADAALRYDSTEAHNARARDAALDLLLPALEARRAAREDFDARR